MAYRRRRVRQKFIALQCAVGLAGCKSEAEERPKRSKQLDLLAEHIAKADDAQRKSNGLQIGTAPYADCRLRLKSLHLEAALSGRTL
jgi:hypothetical protein